MYKIETHLHTTYISHCGWLGAQAIMKAYSAAGYDAICVTDHYNRDTFDYIEMDLSTPGSKTRDFLLGYHRLKREGEKYGIRVYAGAELRFDGSQNDYLLYGFHDELLADPERVMSEGLEAFAPKYRADGALLIRRSLPQQVHSRRPPSCSTASRSSISIRATTATMTLRSLTPRSIICS